MFSSAPVLSPPPLASNHVVLGLVKCCMRNEAGLNPLRKNGYSLTSAIDFSFDLMCQPHKNTKFSAVFFVVS